MVNCMYRKCLVCNKPIYGKKAVGDNRIIYGSKIVGESCYYNGKCGYAHIKCKPKTIKGGVNGNTDI